MPADELDVERDAQRAAEEIVALLADEIGPRRPTSAAEERAATALAERLGSVGAQTRIQPFRGVSTFAWAQAVPLAAALLRPGPLGLVLGAAEAELRLQLLTRLVSRRASQNVLASVEPKGDAVRTVALVSHLDSSRSGLLFHPALAPHLRRLLDASSAALLVVGLAPVLRRWRIGRAAVSAARAFAAFGLGLLAERELRGHDVPGANDNASGVAVSAAVLGELARAPLASTRVVMVATGCEESGTVGMRAFLQRTDTTGWLFVNLDGVGAPATLRYLPREGVGRVYSADPGLLELCARLERDRPELGLRRAERLVGLTYDATPVLARGGRAITLSAQDETIPNYHTPADNTANLDAGTLGRAHAVVRALLDAIDAGGADAPARDD
jgi:hypothetical protein